MYAMVEDNIEKYYTEALKKLLANVNTSDELISKMEEHKHLLEGSDENYEDGLGMLWNEYWLKILLKELTDIR